jgi:hypothetical protein
MYLSTICWLHSVWQCAAACNRWFEWCLGRARRSEGRANSGKMLGHCLQATEPWITERATYALLEDSIWGSPGHGCSARPLSAVGWTAVDEPGPDPARCVAGSRCGLGEEVVQVLAGDDAAAADLEVGELPGAHLVIEQVAGEPGNRCGLVHGVGEPVHGLLTGGAGHGFLHSAPL